MQQGAQLCFNGNFLVDRSEYPPLASRVLTSSGVAALLRRHFVGRVGGGERPIRENRHGLQTSDPQKGTVPILVQGDEGPAQVIQLGHQGTPSF